MERAPIGGADSLRGEEFAMDETIGDWVNWLRLRKSVRTVEAYEWELRRLASVYPGKAALNFRERDLTQYLAERRMLDGVGDSSIKRGVGALRSFFGWVSGKKSPAARLPYPRVRPRQQRSLTADELGRVLAACDSSSDKGRRDLALLCLMVDTGLRASEVCRLRLADVDLGRCALRVIIKGGRESGAVFTRYTAAQLAAWFDVRSRYAGEGVGEAFVSLGGLRRGTALTREGLRTEILKIGARAGVTLSPHDLRRTFATLSTLAGASARVVQVAGRWSSLAMVERYTAAIAAEAIRGYLPLAGWA